MKKQKTTFEEALKSLEEIVKELETGELPLEDAFKKFEEGVTLSKICTGKLDETEKKVTLLLKDKDAGIVETEFSSESE